MIESFNKWEEKLFAYSFALNTISWDAETEAPIESVEYRSKMVGFLYGEKFSHMTDKENIEVINKLLSDDSLDDLTRRRLQKYKKDIDKIVKIPKDEYIEYQRVLVESQQKWENAKHKKDYSIFKDYLGKIIDYQRKFINYYGFDGEPYNSLLDDYEEGMTTAEYDEFFNTLKNDLVPFVKEYIAKKRDIRTDFLSRNYSEAKQKEYVEYLMDVFRFDKNRGLLKKSVHPFTWGTHSNDVRFTVSYLDEDFTSSIFSGGHELGHALYNQNIDPKFNGSNLYDGASLGIHESQSRFYENHVLRSKEFWSVHFDKLKETFKEQLEDVSVDEFYALINKAEASFIRVEADELTYPLHIMIRYEIERDIFAGKVDVDELPTLWNKKVEEYLGITPSNDSEGLLQDVHWSFGLFGYFPTYALGSAISAQLYNKLINEIDFNDAILNNKMEIINDWLKEKVHKYGASKTPNEIVTNATGESFNPKYYVKYLINKYSNL